MIQQEDEFVRMLVLRDSLGYGGLDLHGND